MSATYDVTRTGPVATAFLRGREHVSAILGPVGSGKTAACIWRIIQAARWQARSPIDGRKRLKCVVIRDTYPELMRTTLPSWRQFFPPETGSFSGEVPITHKMLLPVEGDLLDIEVIFVAVGDARIEQVTSGLEINAVWINEADLLPGELFRALLGRVAQGRYPSPQHGGPAKWWGLWCDFNAPDTENWTYETFVESLPEHWRFYRQPPGIVRAANGSWSINPLAENLKVQTRLGAAYLEQAHSLQDWELRRKVLVEFGYSRDGKPVYGESWNDGLHVAHGAIEANPLQRIEVGLDQGFYPAAVFGQRAPSGARVILGELIGDNVQAGEFGDMFNAFVARQFPQHRGPDRLFGWYDPAAAFRSANRASSADPSAWIDMFCKTTGLRAQPAPSNNVDVRVNAVTAELRRLVGGAPAFRLSPECRVLRKGFASGYRLKRQGKADGKATYQAVPEKNFFSHAHDALQYLVLGDGGFGDVMGRKDAAAPDLKMLLSKAGDWNPLPAHL